MLRAFLLVYFSVAWTLVSAQKVDSLIKESIFFGGGSYYIDDEQQLKLQFLFDKIENIHEYEVVLFSHTDNIGGKEYNEWLSMMRSRAVIRQLEIIGIPKELTDIKDFGQNNPLYTNSTTNGRMLNRRVDVILVPITF